MQFCIYYTGNSYNINDWYFDDIQFFTLENLDLGLTSTSFPDFVGSGEHTEGITVFNYGATTVTDVEASYTVEGFETVTETFAVNIASLGSETLNFTTPAVLAPGDYQMSFSINLVNGVEDDVIDNNNPGRFTYTKYQMNWPGTVSNQRVVVSH